MPYDLKELAAISGQSGLFKLVRPARHGVLVESLDSKATRSLAPASNKVSLLSEIGIYQQDSDETAPLTDVFERIYQKYGTSLPVTGKSSEAELSSFLGEVLPDYDRQRVYQSDIRKLVTWYGIVSEHRPYQAAEAAAETPATAAEEPAADEPLSTGGLIENQDDPQAAGQGNPETVETTKKKRAAPKKKDAAAE